MKIYLLRHGKTKMNEEAKMQGRINTELSRKGQKDVEELRKKLEDYNFDVCFSSPLIRAMQTAFTVVGDKCLIIKDDRLIERDLGNLEEKPIADYEEEFWLEKENLITNKVELIDDVYKRVEEFLNELKDNYSDKNILLVSHSVVIRCLHNILNNIKENPDNIRIDNCYFEEIEV